MALKKLGRYEIIGELGKGAMGLVYLARDPLIGRELAIKTFHVGLSAGDRELEQFRARFLREAQSAGILNHPNIVTIHDVVVAEDDAIFIAMEYVKGTDLKQLMQRDSRLDVRFVVDVVAQIADGLAYAHSKGVVHRDIKPANIIITAEKQAKITDFGIAHVDASNLTTEGQLLGTPNYMSPEMIQGKPVDHRADIFSLGVMLYEMLTRKKPFRGENLTTVTHRIVYEAFTPPEEIVPGLPANLTKVLDRALEKDPERRYAQAGEMAADLRATFAPVDRPASKPRPSGSFLAEGSGEGPPVALRPTVAATAQSGAALGATLTGGTATVQPAAGASATAVAAPPAPSAARYGWLAGAAVVLLLALGGIVALTMKKDAPAAGAAAAEPAAAFDPEAELRAQYQPFVERGRELLAAGDPRGAREQLDQALAIVPADRDVRQLRQQAEEAVLRLEGKDPTAAIVEARLTDGREALRQRDYPTAIRYAEEALAQDPANRPARELLAEAQEGQRRKDQVRDRFSNPGTAPPTVAAAVPAPPPPPAAAPAVKTSVGLAFVSEVQEGRLTIYDGLETVYQQSFKPDEKRGGLLRRSAKTPVELSDSFEMTSGKARLRIYVWMKEARETKSTELDVELPADRRAVLHLQMSAEGRLTARLE